MALNTSEAKPKKSKTDTTSTTNNPKTTTTSSANQSPNQQISSAEKVAMCKPNDTSVNTTESKVCGIPKTIPSTTPSNTAVGP